MGRFSSGRRTVLEAEAVFGRWKTGTYFPERGTSGRTNYGRSLSLCSEAVSRKPEKSDGLRLRKLRGVIGCQGTPWSEELHGKELHGALGGECNLEPRGSAVSCTLSTRSQLTFQHLQVWYNADLKGWCFDWSLVLLYYYTAVPQIILSLSSRTVLCTYGRIEWWYSKEICISQPAHYFVFAASVFQGGLSPRTRAAIVVRSGR